MAPLLSNMLLVPTRVILRLYSFLFWAVIYSLSSLSVGFTALRLAWPVCTKPKKMFSWQARKTAPDCLSDTSLGMHHYIQIKDSGLRFHYVAAGEKGKPLLLLLHGFPEIWYSWRYQLREFKSEYFVVAVDLRGYGNSDAPTGRENYKMELLRHDIQDIIEALGYHKCILGGHDWGGILAWSFAVYHPEMVDKLIVMNAPHLTAFKEYLFRHPSQLLKSIYIFFFQVPKLPELVISLNDFSMLKEVMTDSQRGIRSKTHQLTVEDIEAYLYVFSQPGALTGPLNYYRNIFSSFSAKRQDVTVPTLLIWGEKDAFLELGMLPYIEQYVQKQLQKYVVPEASHWVQQDQPEVVNKLMWSFLKQKIK
ncbi:epoxide hydrolase 3 [Protopterus annectens]|uniref:epoxide hydrolase 3 n=1 Tax=Protopterus annectens TaxID=7888 RepID=UPI001CFAA542|nr:epoxide hydrolase 3 [Protopterus annectens]